MNTKEEYLEMAKEKLTEWKGKLNELKQKAAQYAAESRGQVEEEVGNLENQFREVEGPIQQMIQSGEMTADKFREVVQPAEKKMDEAFKSVQIKFQ